MSATDIRRDLAGCVHHISILVIDCVHRIHWDSVHPVLLPVTNSEPFNCYH